MAQNYTGQIRADTIRQAFKINQRRRIPARRIRSYFCCVGGVGVFGAGAGCVFTGCDFTPCNTEVGPLRRKAYTDKVMEVTINATADQVVALESALAAPRGPNAVWLPCPPNAAEISPLLPLCNRTTMIMKRQTRMWMVVIR